MRKINPARGIVAMVILFAGAISLHGAVSPHGKQRLRELAVFPAMNMTFSFGYDFAD